jgi:hypothetical protein
MMEEWRSVVGWEGYEVSSLGRVRSWRPRNRRASTPVTPRLLRLALVEGYPSVTLCGGHGRVHSARVHRLVLEAFVGPGPEGMEACHGPDQTRTNCALSNLRWDTRSANNKDKLATGRQNTQRLTQHLVVWMRWMHADHGASARSLAAWLGCSFACAANVLRGITWRHL